MRTASRNHSADLLPEIEDELIQFVSLCRNMTTDLSPSNMMRLLKEQQLQCDIVLRIYLTLPVSNATGERSFSKLIKLRTYKKKRLRTTMTETRLNFLTEMSTEFDLLRQIDFNYLICDLAF